MIPFTLNIFIHVYMFTNEKENIKAGKGMDQKLLTIGARMIFFCFIYFCIIWYVPV